MMYIGVDEDSMEESVEILANEQAVLKIMPCKTCPNSLYSDFLFPFSFFIFNESSQES